MAMQDYFETYFVQERAEVQTGYAPPFDVTKRFVDARAVNGRFIQNTSDSAVKAMADGVETRGRFVCDVGCEIHDKDVIRRESDNTLFIIIGKPFIAPGRATSQFKYYLAKESQERGGDMREH